MAKVSNALALAGEFMKFLKLLFVGVLVILVSACANGHCKRGVKGEKMDAQSRVFVHKPDGSVQCEKNSGKSLEVMAKDLDGVKIYSQSKKSDGMMRIQVCGAATGMSNVYEIDSANLQRALDVGFKVWKEPGS